MRYLACIIFAFTMAAAGPVAAAETQQPKGIWLLTDYPALSAQAGQSATIKLKLENDNLPPVRLDLSVEGVPSGWRATLLGDGTPVAAAMPGTNQSVSLQLRVDIPAGAPAGTETLTLRAKGGDIDAALPIAITTGETLPAQLAIKASLPSLRGTPQSSFEYQFTVTNQGDKDALVKLAAAAPPGFQTSFTEAYGSQEISSISIGAGQNKDLKVKVQPPSDVRAGDYPVEVQVVAEGAAAQATMTLQITGQPKLGLTGQGGRLSSSAEAGKATPLTLVLSNDGSAPARDVELSAAPPSDWTVTFEPQKIDVLEAGQKRNIQALLTPSSKAIAGDYMTNISASNAGNSTSADFRITVRTSTLWGVAGIAIIAAALLIGVGAVARFGRR